MEGLEGTSPPPKIGRGGKRNINLGMCNLQCHLGWVTIIKIIQEIILELLWMSVRAFPKRIETHPKYGLCHFMGLGQRWVKKGRRRSGESGKSTFLCCVGWCIRSSQQSTLPLFPSGGHMLGHSKETINWSSQSVQLGYSQAPELVGIRKWQF